MAIYYLLIFAIIMELHNALPEVGEEYVGKVKNIMPFGAFVEFMPGKDGLLHISEITWERLESMEGVLEIEDQLCKIFNGIDIMVGRRRYQGHAGG